MKRWVLLTGLIGAALLLSAYAIRSVHSITVPPYAWLCGPMPPFSAHRVRKGMKHEQVAWTIGYPAT